MKPSDIIYVGVKGSVAAFQKSDGVKLWESRLKAKSLVTLLVEGPRVFAHTNGELFCLDAITGDQLWKDELDGLGYGLASLAVDGATSPSSVAVESIDRAKAAAASAGVA